MRVAILAVLAIACLSGYARSESEWMEQLLDELTKHDREELDTSAAKDKMDVDASASQEREETTPKPKKKSEEQDESDEDDDDDDIGLGPVLSMPNIFRLLTTHAAKPWWMGEHVCIERTEGTKDDDESGKSTPYSGIFIMTGTARYSTCQNGPNKYVCTTVVQENGKTTKSTIVKKCCKGFRLGASGCEKIETKPIEEIAMDLGCSEFTNLAKKEGLEEELEGEKTIFLPLDSAMNEVDNTNSILTNEVLEPADKMKRSSVEQHIVDGVVERGEFENDMVLNTMNNSTIRINGYPGGIITANCVPINKTDKFTKNSVIHVVEKLLTSPEKTVGEILQEHYPKFKTFLESANLVKDLDSKDSSFTILAVSDKNLDNFDPENANCLSTILKHHVIPRTVCTAGAKNGKIFSSDVQGEYVSFENDNDNLIVGGKAKMNRPDILGSNGVVHEIDQLITPPSAVGALDLLRKTNHTRFLDLIEKSGLMQWLEKAKNITLFVPVEESLEKLEKLEKEELVNAIKYHIAHGKHDLHNLSVSNGIPTKHGEDIKVTSNRNILASLFGSPGLDVQCARLTRVDGQICNGVAHEVSKPILPPWKSFMDVLENPDFSKFKSTIQNTKLFEKLKNSESSRGFTLLAVKNDGFDKLSERDMKLLQEDEDTKERFLQSHVLPGSTCCSRMNGGPWPFVSPIRNILGQVLSFDRTRSGMKLGGAKIQECDLVAKDGIVHVIEEPLNTSARLAGHSISVRKPGSEIILTGF
ncbi:periostin [Cimex lectularius]|uniref:FAS1 domain-containing protein n=1 Tax=Cimex lectularius TaxID=79782 RepID=A0A8I6SFV2_CIMLE|nr:periostin [Cimex lectularius]